MLSELIMSAAVLCGQPGSPPAALPPAVATPAENPAFRLLIVPPAADIPAPPWGVQKSTSPYAADVPTPPWSVAGESNLPERPAALQPAAPDAPAAPAPAEADEEKPAAPPAPAAPAATPPDRWLLMRALQGTWYGAKLDGTRTTVSGWVEMSYTGSTPNNTGNAPAGGNLPMTWNDRANMFDVQQFWLRLDRALVTSGTTKPTFGGRVDMLYGTDYRFSMMRGLFNDQLVSPPGVQNWYGFDMPQFYANVYIPTILSGLELRVGKFYTPWGEESIEAVSTPFVSRSYAFTNCPPFTHFGAMAILNINPKWQLTAAAVDGNDIWVGDPAQEWRFVGKLQFTSASKRWVVALAGTLGRANFDPTQPTSPAFGTLGTANEPGGRNNLNAVDLLVTKQQSSRLSFAYEAIYGWQYAPPGTPFFAADGHATWLSMAGYAFYTLTPRLQIETRAENFWDNQGQRSGFAGHYYEGTLGLQWKPRKDVIVRPELRYDAHDTLTPFDNGTQKNLFTAAIDLILRY